MNINLSGKQLLRPDVVDRVQEVLHTTGVEPSSIKLEITESVMMTDLEPTIERLYALKKLGVKLVMDDFGTGYSSMSNLHTFPLDDLKIDRAFVHRLSSDGAGAGRIIGAIVAMAKALRLDVIGEGVETLQQADQLKILGCDTVQGFYFALPATADALERFMEVGAESLLKGAGLDGLDGPDGDATSVRCTSPGAFEETWSREQGLVC
jgi:EAL domain-containing protein (putative c-di-GMP-specific phosphodiesterase class I)